MAPIPAEPRPLTTLVETQPDTVVSRVLLRTQGCTITAFAFAEGEGLTEHTSPHTAVVQMLEGQMKITLRHDDERGEVTHTMCRGDILRIPPSVPHALYGRGAFKMLLTLARDDAPR